MAHHPLCAVFTSGDVLMSLRVPHFPYNDGLWSNYVTTQAIRIRAEHTHGVCSVDQKKGALLWWEMYFTALSVSPRGCVCPSLAAVEAIWDVSDCLSQPSYHNGPSATEGLLLGWPTCAGDFFFNRALNQSHCWHRCCGSVSEESSDEQTELRELRGV